MEEKDQGQDLFLHTIGMNTPNLSAQRKDPHTIRMPKLQITELKSDSLQLIVSDTDVSVVNALRRIVYAEVPTMAMDMVEIITNTSCLTDEFIAHRLGLIPLTSHTVDQFKTFRDCDCSDKASANCPNCSVEFSLDVTCPPHQESVSVTTLDLMSTNPDVMPVQQFEDDDPILLLKLGRNQSIKMRAVARKGFGKEHAKYCPVSVCVYQFVADIRVNERAAAELSDDNKKRFVASCPRTVFAYNDDSHSIVVAQPQDCIFCQECTKEATEMGAPNLTFVGCKPGRFVFNIETLGQLAPEAVMRSALRVLKEKLAMVKSELTVVAQEQR